MQICILVGIISEDILKHRCGPSEGRTIRTHGSAMWGGKKGLLLVKIINTSCVTAGDGGLACQRVRLSCVFVYLNLSLDFGEC